MAQILKLPVAASKLGYRRVRKRARSDAPGQLDLFAQSSGTAQILAFAPPNSTAFEQALLLDERCDDRAAELYSRAIEEEDCVADAYCNLGIIETQRGNTMKAFDCFTRCLKQDPRHSEAHYNLANLYFDLNDFRLAQLHFEIAVEVDPGFANSYFNLALVQAINNDTAASLRTLARYQELVSADEGRAARDLLENLRRSLATAKRSMVNARPGTGG